MICRQKWNLLAIKGVGKQTHDFSMNAVVKEHS
nr:MAG TPA: hypothetical protein [Caudoviricetes sp.]